MDMSSPLKPQNTIEEENEEDNREQDDFGSDEDSQNDSRSSSENSEVEQEHEENPENDTLVQQQEGESSDQDEETSNSEQEAEPNQEEEEEEEEDEEEDEEEEEIVEEKEERPTPPPKTQPKRQQDNRAIPRSMYYREQQRQHQQRQQQVQQRQQRQQRQRKRWVSPHRSNQRVHEQRMRDFKDNYMGDPLSLRLHLAQVDGLKEELSNALQDALAKTDYISELEQRLKTMEIDNSQLHKVNLLTERKAESFQKSLGECREQCDALASELGGAKSEIERLKQGVKAENSASSGLERRLSQANAEIEKTKNEFAKLREASREQDEGYKKKIEEMAREKKVLEKQNLEMQKVIKKHMQLIGNLRRQVMHVEAATVLRLSEEQFVKALEKNSCGRFKDNSFHD